ncbi:DNA ligase [Aureococcus anophagefferens]|nr:DNA ligase [Aureococcus anophagefferens]
MRGAVALVASERHARARAATRLASAAPRNLEALEAELAKHDDLYYNAAAPTLSDGEYDALAARVDALRAAHALAPRAVGGDGVEAAVAKWLKKAQRACKGEPLGAIVCEPKLDGLSVSLRYEDGALVQAATRGDGVQGDDVTANARAVAGVVESLGARGAVEIRGEVCVAVQTFRELAGADAANPRNYAAGSLRQSDAEETRRRRLRFVAHDAVGDAVAAVDGDDVEACAPALAAYHAELGARRPAVDSPAADELRYEIDGAVFKVDARGAARVHGRAPRSRVALKFEAEVLAATTLEGVEIGVGKRGVLTPVAKVAPVAVGGVVVRSATLHNFAMLRNPARGRRVQGLGAAGDLPVLRARTVVDEDAGRATCPNGVGCDDQAAGRLAHFVGRGAIDLASGALGKKKLRQLVREGVARSPADLFDLLDDRDAAARRLEALDGWASTSAAKLLDALEARAARPLPLADFVYALGANRVGKAAAASRPRGDLGRALGRARRGRRDGRGRGPPRGARGRARRRRRALAGLRELAADADDRDVAAAQRGSRSPRRRLGVRTGASGARGR